MRNFTTILVPTELENLAVSLVSGDEVTSDNLADFVIELDGYLLDLQFTKKIYDKFKVILEEEGEI